MKLFTSLLLAIILIFSGNTFAQKLNEKQLATVQKDVAKMAQVMELSAEQKLKISKIKTAQAIEVKKLSQSTEKGTTERKEGYLLIGKKYNSQCKEVVSPKQWAKWTNRNKVAKTKQVKRVSAPKAKVKKLKKKPAHILKIEAQVEEMTKVMELTSEQKEKVLNIKMEQQAKIGQLKKKYEKGSDKYKEANKTINKEANKQIVEATSQKQMNKWYKRAKK